MEATTGDLTDPLINHADGQLFLHEAFKIIVEEVLCKGTDVKEKVSEDKSTRNTNACWITTGFLN